MGNKIKLSRKKTMLFSGAALFLFLLAGELILRLSGYAPVETAYLNVPGVHHLHKPNWKGFWDGKFLTTNQWGLRGDDFPKEKPAGEFRILCLGDSVTFGFGLDMGEDYPARLENILNIRDKGSPRYRAINTGVDAYSTREEVEYYLRFGAGFNPDKVILGICLNDVTEVNLPLDVPLKNWLKKSAYFYFFKKIRARLIVSDIKGRDNRIYGLRDDVTSAKVSNETAKSWEKVFSEIRRLKAAMGGRASSDLLVLLFPVRSQLTNSETGAEERVARFCGQEGLVYKDPLPVLKNCKGNVFLDEIHLSAAGCSCVAEWLAGFYPRHVEP